MKKTKEEAYRELIEDVKASYPVYDPTYKGNQVRLYWCEACQEINLWTYWQGRNSLDAKIMLVGQDWGSPWDQASQKTLQQISAANDGKPYIYMEENQSKTDKNLCELFKLLDYNITERCPDLFFTNFIVGYRHRGFSGGYKKAWCDHDKEFFHRLANIVQPRVILCLGRSTFDGVLEAFSKSEPIQNYNQFIESDKNPVKVLLRDGSLTFIFALAHCGVMGTLNRNRGKANGKDSLEAQVEDWRRIAQYLKTDNV